MEISRARHRAELVTDDATALREQLEAVTGERIAALEAVVPVIEKALAMDDAKGKGAATGAERMPGMRDAGPDSDYAKDAPSAPAKKEEPEKARESRGIDMEM